MRVLVGKRYYNLVFEKNPYCNGKPADGYCDPPCVKGKRIVLRNSLHNNPERLLCVLFHELLHAHGWHLDEAFVASYCEDAARIAVKLGFDCPIRKYPREKP
jgi:hypothetical protein